MGTRTPDPLIKSQLLYQLSYAPMGQKPFMTRKLYTLFPKMQVFIARPKIPQRYPYLCKVARPHVIIINVNGCTTRPKNKKEKKMKKIAIPVLAAVIACPAMAGQYHNESFWDSLDPYIALRVGAGYSNLNYRYNGYKESLSDQEMHARAALGLSMYCHRARTEIEWSMLTKLKDDNSFGDDQVNVDTKLNTLLMNAYMDFGDYEMIRPFIGLGAGVAFVDQSREIAGVGTKNNDQTKFSAMGALGVTFDWRIFAVDLAFRYTYADVNSGIHNFAGDIGMRYMF